MKKFIIFTFTIIFILNTFTGCAVNPVTGQKELMLVSEDQEIQMGKDFYPNALWGDLGGGGIYQDERLRTYLKDIVLKIHSVSHRPNLPVDFEIQNSSVPNAWAIPGYVVITRGLLANLDNEGEFVFVMGHEMGHVSARHSARQMTSGMLANIGLLATGIALSEKSYAGAALNIGAIGSSLLLLKYSREHELEADRLGVLYMTKLGYDPQNALSAHRNLEKISKEFLKTVGKSTEERSFIEDLFSTHPRTSVRIEEIQQIIKNSGHYNVIGDGSNRNRFQSAISNLKRTNSLYTEYYDKAITALSQNRPDEALSLISSALGKDKTQPSFYGLKGFIMIRKKNYPEAERSFDEALRLNNNYQPAYRGKGIVYYFNEDYKNSVLYLKKGVSLFPNDATSHYFLGMSYYRTKNYREAIYHLDQFASAYPNDPEIHGILGTSYEHMNDINSAYREYLLQIKVAPDNEIGRHAASRAAALKPLVETQKK